MAVNSLDEPAFAQNLGGPSDGEVGDAVFLSEITLRGQTGAGPQRPGANPRLDVAGHGGVDELGPLRVGGRHGAGSPWSWPPTSASTSTRM